MESGITGVGESSIDAQVDSHIQEQQTEVAIANGVGVASVLDAVVNPEPIVSSSNTAGDNTASGGQAVVPTIHFAVGSGRIAKTIVEPINLKETQTAKTETESLHRKKQFRPMIISRKRDRKQSQEGIKKVRNSFRETSSENQIGNTPRPRQRLLLKQYRDCYK